MKRGTINFDGKDYDIVDQVVESTTPVTLPQLSDLKLLKLTIADNGADVKVTWEVSGGSGIYGYSLGTYVADGTLLRMPKNMKWTMKIFDKVNTSKFVICEIDSAKFGIVNFNETGSPIVVEAVVTPPVVAPIVVEAVVTPPVVAPIVVESKTPQLIPAITGFAEVGKKYISGIKPILHCSTRNASAEAQYYTVYRNGNLIFGIDRYNLEQPENDYWGNHPLESQHAVENGVYEFYIKNTGRNPIIFGVTSGNQYSFYNIVGELAKTDIHKELEAGQDWAFSLNVYDKTPKQDIFRNWDKTQNAFHFTCPFYENGKLTTAKIICEGRENGLELGEYINQSFKFYKKDDRNKYIVVNFETTSINQASFFTVIEKKGLEINPDFTMLTCFSSTIWKIFNNDSVGYIDSKYYKQQ